VERRGTSAIGRPLVILCRIEDGLCWSAYLIKTGGAYAYKQVEFRDFKKLLAMEREAKESGVGLWKGYPVQPRASHLTARKARPFYAETVFSPRNFIPPKKRPRYASQAVARAEFDAMMGAMYRGMYGAGSYGAGGSFDPAKTVYVHGYYRSNGTWVEPYWRRPPSR
jgi:hypothetical protein